MDKEACGGGSGLEIASSDIKKRKRKKKGG
jgi:hypothetical protein